jgi:hypothetical protein
VGKERGLADAGLAGDDQRPAAAGASNLEEVADSRLFSAAGDQHRAIVLPSLPRLTTGDFAGERRPAFVANCTAWVS